MRYYNKKVILSEVSQCVSFLTILIRNHQFTHHFYITGYQNSSLFIECFTCYNPFNENDSTSQ